MSGDVRVILAGHSHTHCCRRALSDADSRELEVLTSQATPDRAFWDNLLTKSMNRNVALMWLGNQHNTSFMFSNHHLFDVVLGMPNESVEPDHDILPVEAIRQHYAPTLSDLSGLISDVKTAGAKSVMVVGTPPPRGTEAELRERFPKEGFHDQYARAHRLDLQTIPITKLSVRIKLWRILQCQTEDIAKAAGAIFLPSPTIAESGDGSLLPEFWAYDATHANSDYGSIVNKMILQSI